MTTLSDGTMVEVEPILVVRSVVAALVYGKSREKVMFD